MVLLLRLGRPVEGEERRVDVEQRLLLSLGEHGVGEDGELDGSADALLETDDPRSHVELLGGDAQRLGQLLQDLCRRPAQPALDLAQVRVGDACLLGELTQRQLRADALLPEVVAEGLDGVADLAHCHTPTVLATASTCKRRECESLHNAQSYALATACTQDGTRRQRLVHNGRAAGATRPTIEAWTS